MSTILMLACNMRLLLKTVQVVNKEQCMADISYCDWYFGEHACVCMCSVCSVCVCVCVCAGVWLV